MVNAMKIFLILALLLPINVSKCQSSYCIMDIDSGRVLEGRDIYSAHLSASIAKIMTAIVAIENVPLDTIIEITIEDNNQEGSKVYLEVGDKILLYDALMGLMLRSGNDLAHAISRYSDDDFVHLMNSLAQRIGMKSSVFNNPSGLDSVNENYVSAYDMCILTAYALKNEVFKEIFMTKEYKFTSKNNKLVRWESKHRLVREFDNLGGKTGYTKKALRTLVTANVVEGLVCVTLNDPNDFETHLFLLNKYKKNQDIRVFINSDNDFSLSNVFSIMKCLFRRLYA